MNQPWIADIAIPPQLAADCINAQFPELSPAQVTPFGEGWDNVAYRVNDAYLFRFPRRQVAVKLLETETAILPWLAGQLPLPIPTPIFVGRPSPEYPYPFTGYRLLPSITACRADLTDDQRGRLAKPLANFLRALHSTDAAKARDFGAGPDGFDRLNIPRLVDPARERIASLADRRIIGGEIAARLTQIIANTPTDIPARTDVFVHGDLYARHLFVSSNDPGTLTGIIDWGDTHLGDPALDLAVAFTLFPPAAREKFWSAYGQPDERTQALSRFRAICGMSWIIDYAAGTNETDLLREGINALRNITA